MECTWNVEATFDTELEAFDKDSLLKMQTGVDSHSKIGAISHSELLITD